VYICNGRWGWGDEILIESIDEAIIYTDTLRACAMIVSLRLRLRVWWRLEIYLRTAWKSIARRWHCRERGRKSAKSYRGYAEGARENAKMGL
jgi:hypothetical protein